MTCAGSGHPCGIIDGSCVEGCLSGYTGKTCHQALPQNLDSEGSDYKTWAIAATAAAVVVFVVAVVIIGILVWRFRHRSSETQLNNRMTTGNEEGKPESEGVLFDNVDGGKLSKFKTLDTANNHDGTDYQPSQDLCQHEYEKPMPTPQDSHEYKIAGNEYVTPNEYENPQEIVKNSEHPTEVTGNNEILNAKDDMKESVYYLAD